MTSLYSLGQETVGIYCFDSVAPLVVRGSGYLVRGALRAQLLHCGAEDVLARDSDWKSVAVGLRVVVPLDIKFCPIVLERQPR